MSWQAKKGQPTKAEDTCINRVRQQRAAIGELQHGNELLKADLARESRECRYVTNPAAVNEISRLQDQANLYAKKIEVERRRIEELDRQLAVTQAKVLDQRRRMGGVNASQENNEMISKQIRTLENRLDKALVKLNESLSHNRKLRERIDAMRRERVVFDGIYKKLERELHEKKREMGAIIADSSSAYQARDKAQSEMVALRQQAAKDRADFEAEWRELGRLIDQDRRLRGSLRQKQLERAREQRVEVTQGASVNGGSGGGLGGGSGGMGGAGGNGGEDGAETGGSPAGGRDRRGHATAGSDGGDAGLGGGGGNSGGAGGSRGGGDGNGDGAWGRGGGGGGGAGREGGNGGGRDGFSPAAALVHIQAETGASTLEEVLTMFTESEERNFSLFNYINDVNVEIERLEIMSADVRGEIERYRGQGVSTDSQRKKILRSLETQLDRTASKADEYETRHQAAMAVINQLKSGIHSIYTKVTAGAVAGANAANGGGGSGGTGSTATTTGGGAGRTADAAPGARAGGGAGAGSPGGGSAVTAGNGSSGAGGGGGSGAAAGGGASGSNGNGGTSSGGGRGSSNSAAMAEEMLGNQGVNESNMLQYLGIIEHRTNTILQTCAKAQHRLGSAPLPGQQQLTDCTRAATAPALTGACGTGQLPPGQAPPGQQQQHQSAARLTIQPPSWDDCSSGDEEEDEDDERPLTREELKSRTLRGSRKTRHGGGGSGSTGDDGPIPSPGMLPNAHGEAAMGRK